MASSASLKPGLIGLSGVSPNFAFLETDEDYATITAPGYLNGISLAGINLDERYIVFGYYGNPGQIGVFTISTDNGVHTLEVYTANSNSFEFTNTQFVAKGGSDLSPGNSIGFPKLTIQAAIDALNLSPSTRGTVVVLDGETYVENVTLKFNMSLWMPNAWIAPVTGDAINIDDTGSNTVAQVTASNIGSDSGFAIKVSGSQSILFCNADIVLGNIYDEGGLLLNATALVQSNIHITSTGQFGPQISNSIAVTETYDVGSVVLGKIGSVNGSLSQDKIYGRNNFLSKITFQQDELQETVGRILDIDDGVATIQFNSVTDDAYTLPQTSDVAIPVGSVVTFVQLGLGRANFVEGAGVTIVSLLGNQVSTRGSGSKAFAEKLTDTIWIVSGDIELTTGP